MKLKQKPAFTLHCLEMARQVADYARELGVNPEEGRQRRVTNHLGAALADCILQAGLNYNSVVKKRVERIILYYPEAATLNGTLEIVRQGIVQDFLLWKHFEKIERFGRLVKLLEKYKINDTLALSSWLHRDTYRKRMLELPGIGPKTVDYLCGLVGMDCIAVDRHIKTFAYNAGVGAKSYKELQLVISYAADLLEFPRRDFDAWIWRSLSQKYLQDTQEKPNDIKAKKTFIETPSQLAA